MSGVVTVTGKPVEFSNDNAIESVFITVFDHSLKFGTVVRFGGQCAIDIVADDVDFGAFGKFHTFAKLPFDTCFRLIIRTIPRINHCFHYRLSPFFNLLFSIKIYKLFSFNKKSNRFNINTPFSL